MRRVANVYVNGHRGLTPAMRALCDGNDIGCIEIDVTGNRPLIDQVRDQAGSLDLPVVELDGTFVAVRSILELSRILGLILPERAPDPYGACC